MLGIRLDDFLIEVREMRALLAHILAQVHDLRREAEKQTALLKILAEQNEERAGE